MIISEEAAVQWVRDRVELDLHATSRLQQLVALLREENTRQNLVSASSLDDVWRRHVVDSLQLVSFVPSAESASWLDLGTGAGFPGLAIAAMYPSIRMTLVESRSRRVEWLRGAIQALELPHVEVQGRRLQSVPTQAYDVISARAFAPLTTLVDLASRFSTAETFWILPKGQTAARDLASLRGWDHTFHVEQSITDEHAGIIIGRLSGQKGSSS